MTDRELLNELMKRMDREPPAQQPASQPRRLGLPDILMYLVCFVLAAVLLWALVLAPLAERAGLLAPAVQAATAVPTRVQQPASAPQVIYVQQEMVPTAAPQATAGAVIVVTPTYETGCHDGVAYVGGVPVNGTCAGAAFAPESETAFPTPTFMPATAVPPDPTYMTVLRNQAPHCPRCAP